MKTREPPPEDQGKAEAKDDESHTPMQNFQRAASGVMQTPKERVLAAERAERKRKRKRADKP